MPEFNDGASEKQAKEFLLLVGEIRLGPPDLLTRIRLDRITDLERLERMTFQAATVGSWPEVLDSP